MLESRILAQLQRRLCLSFLGEDIQTSGLHELFSGFDV